MYIVKRGKVKPLAVSEGTEIGCSACESALKYFPPDVKTLINESGSMYYINCPVCANVIVILWVYVE
jgi:hypothetical protein